MRSTVVLIPLDTYDQPRVDAAVREGVTPVSYTHLRAHET